MQNWVLKEKEHYSNSELIQNNYPIEQSQKKMNIYSNYKYIFQRS